MIRSSADRLRSATRRRSETSAVDVSDGALARSLASLFRIACDSMTPVTYQSPVDWAEDNVIFASESDPVKGKMDFGLSPYLRDPVNSWEVIPGTGLKEIDVVMPEQMGKTMSWLVGLLWSMVYRPSTSLIYYTSDDKSALVNTTKLLPLMSQIPRFAEYLRLPNARNATQYRLGENIINFGGVGARISSITSAHNIADELDDWQCRAGVDPLQDLRKRARTYSEAILCKVCTVKGTATESRIWREFLASSQGYYYLRCQGCGELSIRSCDTHTLQFAMLPQTDALLHADPDPDSIRLVCPKCGHQHVESDRPALVRGGAYIHRFPERIDTHVGFQCGMLASLFPSASWLNIARAQVNAGRSGSIDSQRYFDNSVRGLPYKPRKVDSTCAKALHMHATAMPEPSVLKWRYLAADTQDDCYYYVVRGVDAYQNTYLIHAGRADTTEELDRLIHAQWHGGGITAAIIDEGGHRQGEVRQLAEQAGVYTYKGNTAIRTRYKRSSEWHKLILADARYWQTQLLTLMYAEAHTDRYYWYTTEDALTPEYVSHLSAYHANATKIGGDALDQWVRSQDSDDHLFDAEKMMCVLVSYMWECAIKPSLRA